MMAGQAIATLLDDGKRLHLHHGPIDLIIEAIGPGREFAYQHAVNRFARLLDELVSELVQLRAPCKPNQKFKYGVARRMQEAVVVHLPGFITPMAAVAGSVADEILQAMIKTAGLDKIYVNNGGDIAFYLTGNHTMTAAIASSVHSQIKICAPHPYRGIATSGWGGRSQSLGIADTVSVVAKNAAMADSAATMIANAVNLPGHKAISRAKATDVFADSDLGAQMVTTGVAPLNARDIATALDCGERLAQKLVAKDVIGSALIILQNHWRQIGAETFSQSHIGDAEYV